MSAAAARQWLAIVKLTRWREHLPYVLPLSLIGALGAARESGIALGWTAIVVLLANILANCLSFMINDIEDAEDDARDPPRAARNVVAIGELDLKTAWLASLGVGLASLFGYALAARSGPEVLGCGVAILGLSVLYSWRRVRLKARPVVDVLSHALMLGGLLVLAGHLAVTPAGHAWWLTAATAFLVSAYGQFHNQLRDFDVDRAAGLRNSAVILGAPATAALARACAALGLACVVLMLVFESVPRWSFGVGALAGLLSWRLRTGTATDMRGTEASDAAAQAQRPLLDALNGLALSWLGASLLTGAA
jgi:4-hydroxybenzoate polyprenyltransferase